MAETTTYQCPNCQGRLRFDSDLGKLKCDFCDLEFTTEEVEQLYAEKQAEKRRLQEEERKRKEEEARIRREQFDAEMRLGMDDIQAGRVVSAGDVEAEMRRLYKK